MTFTEAYKSLDVKQRTSVVSSLMADSISYAAIYSWIAGVRTPKTYVQKKIHKLLIKHANMNIPVTELFPPQS